MSPEAVIVALAVLARRRGIQLSRVKIAKLLYLADLEAVRRGRQPFSGISWVWDNYGPWNHAIYDHLRECHKAGQLDHQLTNNYYGSAEHLYRATAEATTVADAAGDFLDILGDVLEEHGSKTATALQKLTYETAPMLKVQAEGKRGDVLDLTVGSTSFFDSVHEVAEEVANESWDDGLEDLPRWRERPAGPVMTVSRRRYRRT